MTANDFGLPSVGGLEIRPPGDAAIKERNYD